MPFTMSDPNLPEYVKNKPQRIKAKWIAIFNDTYEDQGEEAALIAANSWLKRELENLSKFVKRSVVQFDVDTSHGFIKRSDDGEDYVSLVLNSTEPHKDGKVFSESMLKKWANMINSGEVIVGDVDHTFYDNVLNSEMSDEQVRLALKGKTGIAKAIKAVFEKGKLWIRALIDKRYKKIIEKSQGVSAEALCSWNGDEAIDGELLGFTFNVNSTPADNLAGVVA